MAQLKFIMMAVTIAVLCIGIQTVSAEDSGWVHPVVGGAIEVTKVVEGAFNEVKNVATGVWNLFGWWAQQIEKKYIYNVNTFHESLTNKKFEELKNDFFFLLQSIV